MPGGEDDQGRHGADDQRVREHLKNAVKPLSAGCRVLAPAWAMEAVPIPASLVNTPRETPMRRVRKADPTAPPVKAFGEKAACKNRLKRTGYCPGVAQENPQAEGNVSQGHDRDQVLGYGANPPWRPPKSPGPPEQPAKSPTIRLARGGGESQKDERLVDAGNGGADLGGVPTPKAATMPKAQKSPPSQVHFLPRPFLM